MVTGNSSTQLYLPDRHEAFDTHIYSPAHLIARADQLLTAAYLQRCRSGQLKLTLPQLLYLYAVCANPGGHQAAVARMGGMDTPTGSLVISALERKGLVARRRSKIDMRRKTVEITKQGTAARDKGSSFLALATSDVLAPLTQGERDGLQATLKNIAAHPDASPPALCNAVDEPVAVPDYLPQGVLTGYLLGRCLQIAVALVSPALAPLQLTIRQYVVLALLGVLGPCNLAMLTHTMGAERSSLAVILPSLEKRKLIDVQRENARSLNIGLTRAGLELLGRARPDAEAANKRIASNLAQTERLVFTRALARILDHHGQLLDFTDLEVSQLSA